jgi:hypothetical protein
MGAIRSEVGTFSILREEGPQISQLDRVTDSMNFRSGTAGVL